MSIYFDSRPHAHIEREVLRSLSEQDWSPAGGTSVNRHRQLRNTYAADFLAVFAEHAGQRQASLWITSYGDDVCVGWHDDPHGGYVVASGLEHQVRLAPEQLRSFCRLSYTYAPNENEVAHHKDIGHHYFEPPYAHDTHLHAAHLMAWLDAHRRHLLTIGQLKATTP